MEEKLRTKLIKHVESPKNKQQGTSYKSYQSQKRNTSTYSAHMAMIFE